MPTLTLVRPHRNQIPILRSQKRYNVIRAGRRFGKSTLIPALCAETTVRDDLPVGLFFPRYKLMTEVWRDLVARFRPVARRVREDEKRIELINGTHMEFWTLEDPDAGRSRKYGRIIVDEAGLQRDLRSRWSEALRPTLSDYQGDAYFFGTPKGRKTDYEWFCKRHETDRDWHEFHFSSYDNPHLKKEEIDAMVAELGDLVAAQEVFAEFVDLSDWEPLIPAPQLWDRLLEPTPYDGPEVLAMDAGVTSDCFAVVSVSRHPSDDQIIVPQWSRVWVPSHGPLDFREIETEIKDYVSRRNVIQVTYDPYQLHLFAQRLSDDVWTSPFSQGLERTEADKGLLQLVLDRKLRHAGEPELREHVLNAARKLNSEGRLRMVKPSPDKKIDAAVALAMAAHRSLSLNLY